MMMALGNFVFSLPTLVYQQLERSSNWRHASTDRIGARPASQYLGQGEESITLGGVLAPEFACDPAELDTLRELADEGKPQALVSGNGVVFGAYVITSMRETRTLFFADGTPRRIEFDLNLRRVPDEDMADTVFA